MADEIKDDEVKDKDAEIDGVKDKDIETDEAKDKGTGKAEDKGAEEKIIAYCVKCREKREMKDVKEVQMKGKGGPRRALKGVCVVCGTGMFRILGKA